MDYEKLEAGLCQLPLCQYEFIDTSELTFSERIRTVCEDQCPMYNKSWACPRRWGPWRNVRHAASASPGPS